jgi:hypothetical protein
MKELGSFAVYIVVPFIIAILCLVIFGGINDLFGKKEGGKVIDKIKVIYNYSQILITIVLTLIVSIVVIRLVFSI